MSRWVPVDHPPDLGGGLYLVWTRNTGVEKCRWSESLKKWMGGAWTQHITHWMPMLKGPTEETTVTNADGIRAMSDEELAEFLEGPYGNMETGSAIKWLKQEAENAARKME